MHKFASKNSVPAESTKEPSTATRRVALKVLSYLMNEAEADKIDLTRLMLFQIAACSFP